jgi:hypothetical protein
MNLAHSCGHKAAGYWAGVRRARQCQWGKVRASCGIIRADHLDFQGGVIQASAQSLPSSFRSATAGSR